VEYRTLGRTGLKVSAIGFGCGSIGGLLIRGEAATQRRTVARAIEAGINYFDTAPSYGDGRSEETLGQVLRELRAEVFVGTKLRVEPEQIPEAPAAIRRSLEASLRRLGRERVDLIQLHNRIVTDGTEWRNGLPASAVLGTVLEGLRAVKDAGLARFIGCTGLGEPDAVRQVVTSGALDTVQCYLNALNPSAGWPAAPSGETDFGRLIDSAAAAGLAVLAIRVLAAGALAARDARHPVAGDPGFPLVPGLDYASHVERARLLGGLASELGLEGPIELSLRMVLSHTGVSTALVGFSDPSQLEDALRFAARGPLERSAVERVLQAG